MMSNLESIVESILPQDEVILTGFGIDEKVVECVLGDKLRQIKRLRLVYHRMTLRNTGYLESLLKDNRIRPEIIHIPIGFGHRRSPCPSIFHTKLIVVVRKVSGRRTIKTVGVSSFNWSSYHFSSTRNVFDSLTVFNKKNCDHLDRLLRLPEFLNSTDYELVRISPTLLIFKQDIKNKFSLKIGRKVIQRILIELRPKSIELIIRVETRE